MKYRLLILIYFAIITYSDIYAKYIKVSNIIQYNGKIKTLTPGDSIVLANGVWKDVQLVFKGKGENGKYIYLTAETPGRVTIEGESCLQISGEWLNTSGLVFVNGNTPKKTIVEFRTSSKDYAYNCVMTNCVIDSYNQKSKDIADHWVGVWGKQNSVEYCYFGGKTNTGTTLVIWPDDSNCIDNNHFVYRNYFGPRPPLGSNGGESIRIGTSEVCKNNSGSIVEGNFFERCNGEGEIISNKSGGNKFLNNTFFECEGSLTLRHGNNGVVSGNWFIGNGKKLTGGVRVINEGHRIYNNFFFKLTGDEFRSALSIMNAIPDSPPSGYAAVKNVIVANNTFADCNVPWSFCVNAGEKNCTIKPESTLLINNLVYCLSERELIISYDKTDGITLENNLMVNERGFYKAKGSVSGEVLTRKAGGFVIPFTIKEAKRLPFVKYDISGNSFEKPVIGAFQNNEEVPKVELATAINCGPSWYKPVLSANK
ncbi:MAG: polysaccharide lyase 6 family protein [Bacteroidia bacterium]|nr:polysaccharide lyase 6 family protein [Bacteroidia bacterium]